MRTTVTIQDTLLEEAKRASLERNCSLGEVIEDALRATVARRRKGALRDAQRPLKTFAGSGTLPGVDLTSSSALLEAMESR